MPSHREILQAGVMLMSVDAETRQAIQERVDDALAELYPDDPDRSDDEAVLAATRRALEACPE